MRNEIDLEKLRESMELLRKLREMGFKKKEYELDLLFGGRKVLKKVLVIDTKKPVVLPPQQL